MLKADSFWINQKFTLLKPEKAEMRVMILVICFFNPSPPPLPI